MSHDYKNPVSNETGEYLQEVAEAPKQVSVEVKAEDDKPKPVKKINRR